MIKKFFVMLALVLCCSAFGLFAGCGDIYENLQITVSTDAITLNLSGEDEDEQTTFTTTIIGATEEMSKSVSFWYSDNNIARAAVIDTNGDESTIQITGLNGGECDLRVVSTEYSKVSSSLIHITVYKDATSISFNDNSAPSLYLGGSLLLNTENIIKFEEGHVYPRNVTYSLLQPEDALWNNTYGMTYPTGITITDNLISATSDATRGIIQVLATMGTLKTVVYVMVYQDLSETDIILHEEGIIDELTQLKMTVNGTKNVVPLVASVNVFSMQNVTISARSLDNDIATIAALPNDATMTKYIATSWDTGTTKVEIQVSVKDAVQNKVYKTFTKQYDIIVVRIAKQIFLSNSNVNKTNEPITLNVYNDYPVGVQGTEVHVMVDPTEAKNRQYELRVVEIDGETAGFNRKLDSIQIRSVGSYMYGALLESGTSFYVKYTGNAIANSFKIAIVANTYDPDLPELYNYVTFNIKEGVTNIMPTPVNVKVGVGQTVPFSFEFATNIGNNIGVQNFDVSIVNKNLATIQRVDANNYLITGGSTSGNSIIIITAENGRSIEVPIDVYVEITKFALSTPTIEQEPDIAQRLQNASDNVNEVDGLIDDGVYQLALKLGAQFKVALDYAPTNGSISSWRYSVDDDSYITVQNGFIKAQRVTPEGQNVRLTVSFTFYKYNDGLHAWEDVEGYRIIEISIYQPVTTLVWTNSGGSRTATEQVYDRNTLHYTNADLSTVNMSVTYNSNATFASQLTWTTADEFDAQLVTITPTADTKNVKSSIKIEGHIPNTEDYTQDFYVVRVYGTIQAFDRDIVQVVAIVTVKRAEQISNIKVYNYDDRKGIYLTQVQGANSYLFDILTNPTNVFDNSLEYVVYDAVTNVSGYPVATNIHTTGVNDIISINTVGAVTQIEAVNSGIAIIRIFPKDRITYEDTDIRTIDYYEEVWVSVANGTSVPYRIYNASQLQQLATDSSAWDKNYYLMNSIDLAGIHEWIPIGGETGFSGCISSYRYGLDVGAVKFMISGLRLTGNSAVVTEDNVYIGLFSKILLNNNLQTGWKSGFNNIDLIVDNVNVVLDSFANKTVYIGYLAGQINCNITNVNITTKDYDNNSQGFFTDNGTGINNLYFGSYAGEMQGDLTETIAVVGINFTLQPNTNVIAGGMVGTMNGSIYNEQRLTNKVSIILTTSSNKGFLIDTDSIGGLVGVLQPNKAIYNVQVLGKVYAPNYSCVGGAVGYNQGLLGQVSITNMPYYLLSAVKVLGYNVVGGLVGYNTGDITECQVEFYPNDSTGMENSSVRGNSRVGGLVGYSNGGSIMYSFAITYCKKDLTFQQNTNLLANQYYGDIVANDYVGGLVGYGESMLIKYSFAKNKVSAINGNVGGLVGYFVVNNPSLEISQILNCFVNGEVICTNCVEDADVYNTSNNTIAEFIGQFVAESNSAYIDSCYSFTKVYVAPNDSLNNDWNSKYTICNLIGVIENPSDKVANSFYLAVETDLHSGASIEADLKTGGHNGRYSGGSNWGMGETYIPENNWVWVKYNPLTMSGINDDLLVLYNVNGSMLYNQAITNISITALNSFTEIGDLLPSYLNYDNHGIMVVLDNLYNGESYNALPLATIGGVDGLIDLSILPQLNPEDWTVSVKSSNYGIAEVIQPNLNLIDCKILFKNTGSVSITIQSLRDSTAFVTVQFYVIGGFSEYNIYPQNSNLSVTLNTLNVKLGYAKQVLPVFSRFANYNDSISIQYIFGTANYAQIFNYPAGLVPVVAQVQHLMFGENPTANLAGKVVSVRATPKIKLVFNNVEYFYSVNQNCDFAVRVYQGITDAGLSEDSSSLETKNIRNFSLNILTDNTADVSIATPIVTCIEGIEQFESGVADNILTENGSAVIVENESITYNYLLELPTKYITANIVYTITFKVFNELGVQYGTDYIYTITFMPSSITRINMQNFTYGETSILSGEQESDLIAPGRTGMLKLKVTPYFADFDYLVLSTSKDIATQEYVKMSQLVYKNGNFKNLTTDNIYDENGNLIVRKVSSVISGIEVWDGYIYVSTFVSKTLMENVTFTITVFAKKIGSNNESEITPITLTLYTCFSPDAELTLISNYEGNIVARGSAVSLNISGAVLNSEITISSDYLGNDLFSQCALSNSTFTYRTGNKQFINENILFYVGINAAPINGMITLTINIRSNSINGGIMEEVSHNLTLYVVDYIVKDVYASSTQNGTSLSIDILSYSLMDLRYNLNNFADTTFVEMFAPDDSELQIYNEYKNNIVNSAKAQFHNVNAWGEGNGGIWRFDDGTGYGQISAYSLYNDFSISYVSSGGYYYYIIKGKNIVADIPFSATFESNYVLVNDCYYFTPTFMVEATDELLVGYTRQLQQYFTVDISNNQTEDTPYRIESQTDLKNMTAGASYMLVNDLHLYDWVPINTDIASLDGNGYIIYIHSFAPQTQDENQNTKSIVNVGLWDTLPANTILKNIILDVSYCVWVNIKNVPEVNFGFVAGINQGGMIYNCEVVVTKTVAEWTAIYQETESIYIANSSFQYAQSTFTQIFESEVNHSKASTFILTSANLNGNRVKTFVGGLVGQNYGYITNGRVGRISGSEWLGYSESDADKTFARQGINIFANGNLGGLVGQNSGVVSASYFANAYLVNSSMDIFEYEDDTAKTGGLIAEQKENARVELSYATGMISSIQSTTGRCTLGGIKAYGTIGGLVHTNSGKINNCYSNLVLYSGNAMGGLVYKNNATAKISNCYSASTINNSGLIYGAFIGLDTQGNLLNNENAEITNCYYLADASVTVDSEEKAKEISFAQFNDISASAFDGFVVLNDKKGSWYTDTAKSYLGPQLTQANNITYGHRNTILYEYELNNKLGTAKNPIIIASTADWEKVFNYTNPEVRSIYMDTLAGEIIFDNYYIRIIADLDFNNTMFTTTYSTIFSGNLQANGYQFKNLSYTYSTSSSEVATDFGFFKKVNNGTISNLNLVLTTGITGEALHSGVLAGWINNSIIENVNITGQPDSIIIGSNLVGALTGIITGDSVIQNIYSNISVNSIRSTSQLSAYALYASNNPNSTAISYAGGIVGILDLTESATQKSSPRVRNLVCGGNIDIYGEIVGGIAGLIGANSEIYQANFILNKDSTAKIRGTNSVGGLSGENRGIILNSFIGLSIENQIIQDQEINNNSNSQDYLGYTELFAHAEDTNILGGLVGLSFGGEINNSYSRVAVINNKAKIVGGIIGLSATPQESYIVADNENAILKYIRNITNDNVLSSINDAIVTLDAYIDGTPKLSTTPEFYSSIIDQVYTTGAVLGKNITAGLVGMVLGAPIHTATTSCAIVSVNNHISGLRTYLLDTNKYYGNLVGYLAIEYLGITENSTFALVGGMNGESTNSNVIAGNNFAEFALREIGNRANSYSQINNFYSGMDFKSIAINTAINVFDNFDDSMWLFDTLHQEAVFPILRTTTRGGVIELRDNNFLSELANSTHGAEYRVVEDIVITSEEWNNFTHDFARKSIAQNVEEPLSGRLQGFVAELDGSTRSALITLQDFTLNMQDKFYSLFGFTKNMKFVNLDFYFDTDIRVTSISADDLVYGYGLLAQYSNNTTWENITITFSEEKTASINYVKNFGGIVAQCYNNSFSNVQINISVNNNDYVVVDTMNMGGLFGIADGSTNISGINFGNINFNITSASQSSFNVGGLGGTVQYLVRLISSPSEQGYNITGGINLTINQSRGCAVGGLFGNIANTSNGNSIQTVTNNISINVTSLEGDGDEIKIGGLVGFMNNTNINSVTNIAPITTNLMHGESSVGGIAGRVQNIYSFEGAGNNAEFNGYLINGANNVGDINVTVQQGRLNLGSVFGALKVKLGPSSALPSGQTRKIISALYSESNLIVNGTFGDEIYAYVGGLIGKLEQVNNSNELLERNSVMLLSESASATKIQTTDLEVCYIGGLVGSSNIAIIDCATMGLISYNTEMVGNVLIGGLVGYTYNNITYSVSGCGITISAPMDELHPILYDAVCADKSTFAIINNVFYSSELVGHSSILGTDLTALQMLKHTNYYIDNKVVLNTNSWTYLENEGIQTSFIYPTALGNIISASTKNIWTPVIVSDLNGLTVAFADTIANQKIVMINSQTDINLTYLPNLSINNISRLIGNKIWINVQTSIQDIASADNVGLFNNIPRGVVVSSININVSKLTVNVTSAEKVNLGIFAGSNRGTIYGCMIGANANVTDNDLVVSDFSNNLANKYNEVEDFCNSNAPSIYINISASNANLSIGGLVGDNYGIVTNNLGNTDIVVNVQSANPQVALGGICGNSNYSIIDTNISQGRLIINKNFANLLMGGLVGQVDNSSASENIINSNMMVIDDEDYTDTRANVGLAFGQQNNTFIFGIICNSTISGLHKYEYFATDDIILSPNSVLINSTILNVMKNYSFNINNWGGGNYGINYGLPYIKLFESQLNTGLGTSNSPYLIREGVELTKLTQDKHFAIVKDLIISKNTDFSSASSIVSAKLNGQGHTIYLTSIIQTTKAQGVFDTIGTKAILSRFNIVAKGGDNILNSAGQNFGLLAKVNNGNINNIAVASKSSITIDIPSSNTIGGLVGKSTGSITKCWADVDYVISQGVLGGLVGQMTGNSSKITQCFATGHLDRIGNSNVVIGGLVGKMSNLGEIIGTAVTDCYVDGVSTSAESADRLTLGALIGNAEVLSVTRTYSYVSLMNNPFTELKITGNVNEEFSDYTSSIMVHLESFTFQHPIAEGGINAYCNVLPIAELRSTNTNTGVLVGWSYNVWGRVAVGVTTSTAPYLKEVTPIDRRESRANITPEVTFN